MSASLSIPPRLAPVLDDLTPAQRDAALALGRVLVLAGAGTGKTKTLTAGVATRIELYGMEPSRILCVTFTNKAAREMRERITRACGEGMAPSWLGTFHALCARQLRAEPDIAYLRAGFDIRDADDTLAIVRRLIKATPVEQLPRPEEGEPGDARQIAKMAERISRLKEDLVTPDIAGHHVEAMIARAHAQKRFVDDVGWRFVVGLYGRYQSLLREQNAADFGDLLMWPTLAMLKNETYRYRWSRRFTSVMADEFQDVNRAQFLWLKMISEVSGELFAVGDDSQSIYSWRGAKVGFIRGFSQEFPEAKTFKLEENFRSTAHILDASNAIIAQDPSRIPKTLYTRKGAGKPIEVLQFSYISEEADAIAAEIGRRAAAGCPWHDIAVIYRQNRLSRSIEEALIQARVPYEIVGDVGFYQRVAVKDALALVSLAARPDDRQSDEAFRRVANKPSRGLGAKGLGAIELTAREQDISLLCAVHGARLSQKAATALTEFERVVREVGAQENLSVGDRMRLLLEDTGYFDMLRADDSDEAATQMENLAELADVADRYRKVDHLMEHAALASGAPGEKGKERVQLLTMHRAKGLEFRHVFLPAWEDSLFPGSNARNLDEERRLAYVALTRAMEQATITCCDYRQGTSSIPSRFLDDIPSNNRIRHWNWQDDRGSLSSNRPTWEQTQRELNALGI
ncbi:MULTISPECIES: ATP-dependent helicase [Acetobacter]|uniref:DNA 3'-5' helicase n=1 Tax=Acetobacter cibinongensis TaxID=146475 RepID=A0A1Z5YV40_9PROT|nr:MULTISPECIES: ATP-dependent helicase [Acetobacter]MCG4260889.1 ATP-dependent helicase [Acetobacter senegalensis]OUJ02662.1 DNA helicase II [Acetobacter cibinongensis]